MILRRFHIAMTDELRNYIRYQRRISHSLPYLSSSSACIKSTQLVTNVCFHNQETFFFTTNCVPHRVQNVLPVVIIK